MIKIEIPELEHLKDKGTAKVFYKNPLTKLVNSTIEHIHFDGANDNKNTVIISLSNNMKITISSSTDLEVNTILNLELK